MPQNPLFRLLAYISCDAAPRRVASFILSGWSSDGKACMSCSCLTRRKRC